MKYLIINADDFGYSKIFNEEIIELAELGLISSTTVMVNRINQTQASQVDELKKIKEEKNFSIGLHLDFLDESFEQEIKSQYNKFVLIFGFKPSHLDLHHSEYLEAAYGLIQEFCVENNLACRKHNLKHGIFEEVLTTDFEVLSGTKIEYNEIVQWLKNLENGKTYEILFHPGKFDPDSKSSLNIEREKDIEKIEKLNSILSENGVKLISYNDLKNLKQS